MTAPASACGRRARDDALVAFALTGEDGMRAWTVGSLVVALAAVVFSVVGIPPVPVMWPLYRLGVVLPGCGLTRGVVAVARGDLAGAWRWNPASLLVVVAVAAGIARAAVGAVTDRWLAVRVAPRPWLLALGAVAVAVLWANQWAHADRLMGGS